MIKYDPKTILRWTRLGMRKAFGSIMEQISEKYKDVIVLAADISSSADLNRYADRFPSQFYNLGISEQNMVGVASGLAKEGNNVFIVSFAPFVSMRTYEAVRTLVGYMHSNVKIIALASGLSLGSQGNTHYCMEDLAIMRTIPGMMILSPADCVEEAKSLEYLAGYDGPAFLRLTGIDGNPGVYKEDHIFEPDKCHIIREGDDVAIFATGSIVSECVRVSRALKKDGLSCTVINVHTIKPFAPGFVREVSQEHDMIVTVEEHFVAGGLGGIVAEALSSMPSHAPLLRIGIDDRFPLAGDYAFLLKGCGLTAPDLRQSILTHYRR